MGILLVINLQAVSTVSPGSPPPMCIYRYSVSQELSRLRIDTLCHEGIVSQKVVRFSHLTFRKQNMPHTIQNKDQIGLNWQALRVKDGTMSTLQGSLHSPIKDKCVK